jgi:hypothetical protein
VLASEPEIAERDPAVVTAQDVARLEVAVDDPDGVGRRESASGSEERIENLRERPVAGGQPVGERPAPDQPPSPRTRDRPRWRLRTP